VEIEYKGVKQMELIVGTDSTWSLRVWICSQLASLKLNLTVVDLTKSDYKVEINKYSPTGLVPALKTETFVIYDSLAIAEYFNELSNGALYSNSKAERALSRSLCAEMHSGFMTLRSNCPFTLDVVEPLSELTDAMSNEISRIEDIFKQAQLPFMFAKPGVVDAFYAILAFRLKTYGIVLEGDAGDYQQSLLDWTVLQQSIVLANGWRNTK
jgi:glutathione S-transferase